VKYPEAADAALWRTAEKGNLRVRPVDYAPGLLQIPVWRRLLTGLTILLLTGSVTAWPAADLATINDSQIERLVGSLGTNDTDRSTIKKRLTGWKELLASPKNSSLGDLEKLKLVNDFMHETPFYYDPVMWCMEDYWAKPVEFLANDGGDCEDFAIAKYFTLRALGVADDKLRIVYAVYRKGGQGAFTGAHHCVPSRRNSARRPNARRSSLDRRGAAKREVSAADGCRTRESAGHAHASR
jgi:predicted transglutaminase-like cysteine proteinase